MEFTAAFVNPPKEGGKRATIKTDSGKLIGYFPDKFTFVPGHRYDCSVSEREYQGRTYLNIESQKDITPAGGNGAGGGDRFWLPFVSNTVAHAIAAGKIEGPADIQAWAAAAKAAALALDAKPDAEFDDDIPFR